MVEGEKDRTLYSRFIDGETCRISAPQIQEDRKNSIVRVIAILDEGGFQGVLAILDADFWVLENRQSPSSNIVLTDTHDLETMLLNSPAFDKLLAELVPEVKAVEFIQERGQDIRTALLDMGKSLGYLRWVSLQDGHGLVFRELDFKSLVRVRDFASVSPEEMIRVVKNNTISKASPERRDKAYAIDEQAVKNRVQELQLENYDLWQVCCGHDLICILSIGLRRKLGNYNAKDIGPDMLERELRLAYESRYFEETQLCTSIQTWETDNQPYQVLSLD